MNKHTDHSKLSLVDTWLLLILGHEVFPNSHLPGLNWIEEVRPKWEKKTDKLRIIPYAPKNYIGYWRRFVGNVHTPETWRNYLYMCWNIPGMRKVEDVGFIRTTAGYILNGLGHLKEKDTDRGICSRPSLSKYPSETNRTTNTSTRGTWCRGFRSRGTMSSST